jgi:putative transposase
MRRPNEPALLRAVVSNRANQVGRRPFERQQVFTDEALLLAPLFQTGVHLKRDLPFFLAESRRTNCSDGFLIAVTGYHRSNIGACENAGASRSLMHILALEQGRADELSRQKPRDLFKWVMEARGSQQVLDRYTGARRQYEESSREVDRQNAQVLRCQSVSGSPISDTHGKVSFRQNLVPEEGRFAVKRKRFSVEQIVAVLKQAEVGVPVAELIRQVGITEQALYRWKKQYKGLETDQIRQFKQPGKRMGG